MVAEGWIILGNLRPFVFFLADCVGYDLLPDEVKAIGFGVRDSDAEGGRWYEYEFAGPAPLRFRLGQDPDAGVLHYWVEGPAEVLEQARVAADLMAEYRLSGGRA